MNNLQFVEKSKYINIIKYVTNVHLLNNINLKDFQTNINILFTEFEHDLSTYKTLMMTTSEILPTL